MGESSWEEEEQREEVARGRDLEIARGGKDRPTLMHPQHRRGSLSSALIVKFLKKKH
jgi:hypothetical protein